MSSNLSCRLFDTLISSTYKFAVIFIDYLHNLVRVIANDCSSIGGSHIDRGYANVLNVLGNEVGLR